MLRKTSILLFVGGCILAFNSAIFAKKTCWCWIGPEGGSGWVSQGDPIKWKDFGGIEEYPDITSYNKKARCSENCAKKAANSGILSDLQGLCNLAGRAVSGAEASKVGVFSLVGAGDWGKEVWDYDGRPTNFKGCSHTCTCPKGWVANMTNIDGGITADGKCKKGVCGQTSVAPYPPNGTQIGTWGFTWDNGFFAWGTKANGGAANCLLKAL